VNSFRNYINVYPEYQENHEYALVCEKSPTEEIQSFSEYEDLYSLYTNMFDDDHLHEHPQAYHAVESLHFSFNDKILNDKGEKEYFQALIDQRPIHNNSPSRVHNFENPLQSNFWNIMKHNLIMITPFLMIIFMFQK
jgi:hypothetical protein